MADALTNARQLIEARLRELRDELVHLERVLRNLGGTTDGRRGRRPRRPTTSRSSRRRTTSTREQRMTSLATEARKAPGASNAELARALGVTPSYISQLLAEGKKTGRVARRNGKLVVGKTSANSGAASRRKGTNKRPRRRASARAKSPAARRKTSARAG